MKSLLVVLSLFGLGAAQHWGSQPGVPQDTPEVAAAKAAHLAALARANSGPQQQHWNQPLQQWNPPQQQWNQQQSWSSQQQWRGPVALPPGFDQNGAPLPVQDTPEVQAERARHLSLYNSGNHISTAPNWNQPQQSWRPAPQSWNPAPQSWNPAPQSWNPAPQSWNPAPQPSWNQPAQPGLPVDTPEVAAAKAAHLAAHAQLPTDKRWGR